MTLEQLTMGHRGGWRGWRRGEGKLGRGIRKVWPGLGLEELLFAIILSKGVCEVGGKGEGGWQ